MRIECPKCGGGFVVARERLPAEGLRVPCPRCKKEVQLRPRPAWGAVGALRAVPSADKPATTTPGAATPGPMGSATTTPGPAARGRMASATATPGPMPAASAPMGAGEKTPGPEAAAAPPPPAPNRLLALAGAGLVVLGLGAVGGVVAASARPAASTRAWEARVAAWALAEPDLTGTPDAWLAAGRSALATDTTASLEAARGAFRRAAALAPREPQAILGWLEAVALLETPLRDPITRRTAHDLATALLVARPDDPEVHRVVAHLLLSQGGNARRSQAQAHASRAVEASGGSPRALLARARAFLETSPSRALADAEEALRLDPASSRALLLRAFARLRLDDPEGAADDLRGRLHGDPADPAAFRSLADLALRLGAADALRGWCRELAEAQPEEAALQLARIAWQVDGDRALAQALAEGLLEGEAPLDEGTRARAIALLLALSRGRGESPWEKQADPAAAPELAFQLALHALDRGETEAASAFAARLPEDDEATALLHGRIALARGDLAGAIGRFGTLHERAPWRREPLLFLAAAEAKAAGAPAAFGTLRTLAELDPSRLRAAPGPFHEPITQLLASLEEPLLAGASEAAGDAPAFAGAALVRFHRGEDAEAAQLVREALRRDRGSALALAVRAELALERGDAAGALATARRLTAAERLSPVGPLLAGLAEERLGRSSAARASYLLAIDRRIAYLPALQRLGALEAHAADRAAAEARFREVLARDPNDRDARTALFELRR